MSLGDRCDEIVRLIEEALAEVDSAAPARARAGAVVTPLAPRVSGSTWAEVLRRSGASLPEVPGRAAGF